MRSHHWRKYLLLVLSLFFMAAGAQAAETVVMYIRTGNATEDTESLAAIDYMGTRLNQGGQSVGRTYSRMTMPTFRDAQAFISSRSGGTQYVVVCHGVYVVGLYTGNLRDSSPNSTPEQVVKSMLQNVFHCDENFHNQDAIGKEIAKMNGHTYGPAPSATGALPNTPDNPEGSYDPWSHLWIPNWDAKPY